MNKEFARKLIEHPGEFVTKQLFARAVPGMFWVDWREADTDIVKMAAEATGMDDLTAEWVGGKFVIDRRGNKTEVPLTIYARARVARGHGLRVGHGTEQRGSAR